MAIKLFIPKIDDFFIFIIFSKQKMIKKSKLTSIDRFIKSIKYYTFFII